MDLIEREIGNLEKSLEPVEFEVKLYRDTGAYILTGFDEVHAVLDNCKGKARTLKYAPYGTLFSENIKNVQKKVELLQKTCEILNQVQKKWLFFENIFSNAEFVKHLPLEAKHFRNVEEIWRSVTAVIQQDQGRLVSVLQIDGGVQKLAHCNDLLELIEKGVEDYLEVKRIFFPRFFFVSNDELLEIISKSKDVISSQCHLSHLFEAIHTVEVNEAKEIVKILDKTGESLQFNTPVKTDGTMEQWLLELESSMQQSVYTMLENAREAYTKEKRIDWAQKWQSQAVLTISKLYWTSQVEEAIREGNEALQTLCDKMMGQIQDIVNVLRGDIDPNLRTKLRALLTLDVHARSVTASLCSANVTSIDDFNWKGHLRYYWQDDGLVAKMGNNIQKYGYEYLGNTDRLVITPLTDRCYRTLFDALRANLGGSPQGPAGTGKTETIKDLAKGLGRHCVVISCSDQLDYKAIGKIMKGVASSGAWVCFDEFNRVDIEVLSIAALQFQIILRGLNAGVDMLYLEGSNIRLRPTAGIFVTMNPGYAGRTELPDNMKALFRPIVMYVPDYALITEILLYCSGYANASELSRKVVNAFRLCSEQLSCQDHYDFGMRAVKAISNAAAALKQIYPDEDETCLIVQALNDGHQCKMTRADLPLFDGIMKSLFGDIGQSKSQKSLLEEQIPKTCKEMNLQCTDEFLRKVLQTHKMMQLRHGVMLVGEPGGGKSTVIRVLAASLNKIQEEKGLSLDEKVEYRIINPKSFTMPELYGYMDTANYQWRDGVLSKIFRGFNTTEEPGKKWLVLDGPVDAIWVESMNTVLDDNKMLTLANGEIIKMKSNCSILFETKDLAVASPATVSRCGMVFMEPESLGWKPVFESWKNELPKLLSVESTKQELTNLFEWFVDSCLALVRNCCRELSETCDLNLVTSLMRLLKCQMDDNLTGSQTNADISSQLQGMFLFALTWSVGASTDEKGRDQFDKLVRELMTGKISGETKKKIGLLEGTEGLTIPISVPFPEEEPIYNYKWSATNGKGQWTKWSDELTAVPEISSGASFGDIIVPTIDTVRYTYLLDLLVRHQVPTLIVGPSGTGKSSYLTNYLLNQLDKNIYQPNIINFSAQTRLDQVRDVFMSKLSKANDCLAPATGKKALFFIDEINMPALSCYGAQPSVEPLRDLLDRREWYDMENLTDVSLSQNINIVAAMGPPGGGRNRISPRTLRHFNTITINDFTDESMSRIFTAIMNWHINSMCLEENLSTVIDQVVAGSLTMYRGVTENLLPKPSKPHYTFNMRDFSKVVQGMLLSTKETIEDTASFKRLWVHEVLRVYSDRLVTQEDKDWFFSFTKQVTQDKLNEDFDKLFAHLDSDKDGKVMEKDISGLVFCDFAKQDSRSYCEAKILADAREIARSELTTIDGGKQMQELISFAVEHLSRISRIIKQSRGHAILLGAPGSGRQSLTRLACNMARYDLQEVNITKAYNLQHWRKDLKNILLRVTETNQSSVLFIKDTQITDDTFLEDINGFLSSGEVPGLFSEEEVDMICERMRLMDSQNDREQQTDGSPLALYHLFVKRCREQIHIMLAMSQYGNSFRLRLRMFPGLVNCCTIDYFTSWPEDALLEAATAAFADLTLDDTDKKRCVKLCASIHMEAEALAEKFNQETGRQNYVTCATYKSFLMAFGATLEAKQREYAEEFSRIREGSAALEIAISEVSDSLTAKLESLPSDLGSQTKKRAEEYIRNLQVEQKRWEEKLVELEQTGKVLVANTLLGTAFVTYMGPLTSCYRKQQLNKWVSLVNESDLCCSDDFNFVKAWGEGSDAMDSAVIASLSHRWPLMIDPQGLAGNWVRNLEEENGLRILKQSDSLQNMIETLEECVSCGIPVLLELANEEIDQSLIPLLEKNIIWQNDVPSLTLGSSSVFFNPKSRFYITTKLENPNFLPEISTNLNVINFAVTPDTLIEKVRRLCVKVGRPELDRENDDVTIGLSEDSLELRKMEDSLIDNVMKGATNKETVVKMLLSAIKPIKEEISYKKQIHEKLEAMVKDLSLTLYGPIVTFVRDVYFSVVRLGSIDSMYQYSLQWFISLLHTSVDETKEIADAEQRIATFREHFTDSIYQNVSASLLQKDKLIFPFLMAVNTLDKAEAVSDEEWHFFLTGSFALENEGDDHLAWLTGDAWKLLKNLQYFKAFRDIIKSISRSGSQWKDVFNLAAACEESLPDGFDKSLTKFQKLLLVRCMKPDQLTAAIKKFISDTLGKKYAEPSNSVEGFLFESSSCITPLVIICGPGVEAKKSVQEFAKEKGYDSRVACVALGQGQRDNVFSAVEKAKQEGSWVVLDNCHLAPSLMPTIEKITQELSPEDTHPDFRLWLTSKPFDMFPVSILQNGMKTVLEPPSGLRDIMKSLYDSEQIKDESFCSSVKKQSQWQRMAFGLAFFHTVLLERKKYGRLGLNVEYEFRKTDFDFAMKIIAAECNMDKDIDLERLQYVLAECVFGGRVSDDKDRRMVNSLIKQFLNNEMFATEEYNFEETALVCAPPGGKHSYSTYMFMCLELINQLPNDPDPAVYGLNKNAEVVKRITITENWLKSLLEAQVKPTLQNIPSLKNVQEKAQNILDKLPENINMTILNRKYPSSEIDNLKHFARGEAERYNRLLTTIRTDVQHVSKAIKGLIVASKDIVVIMLNMSRNQIPTKWSRHSYISTKSLADYIIDLCNRLEYMQGWIEAGTPDVYMLSKLFFPQALLTALQLNRARELGVAATELRIQYHVQEEKNSNERPPSDGICIGGLSVEGGKWDRENKVLTEAEPGALLHPIPTVMVRAVKKSLEKVESTGLQYEAPVYRTTERRGVLSTTGHSTNFITFIPLTSNKPADHWIKRGLALICTETNEVYK